ncbi:RNA-directed DNA polymerase, eukaryota, reverse transcriptase zinc-binding domain protein [Tanacetum coccineum]
MDGSNISLKENKQPAPFSTPWWKKDEALNFLKFKKSNVALDDMLSRQKLSQDREGNGGNSVVEGEIEGNQNGGDEIGNLDGSGNGSQNSPVSQHSTENSANTVNDIVIVDSVIKNSVDNSTKEDGSMARNSYANALNKDLIVSLNKLFLVPTGVNEKGEEVVVFDEELVREGSEKWKNIVCGYFVGGSMHVYEMKYNLRRMWGKYGIGDIMKWDPDMTVFKANPSKILVWIKLFNVPLEAWSIKGISTISSRLGKPIMMDQVTSNMCNKGTGRLGYARVLVEIEVVKGFLDSIEINYVDDQYKNKRTKWVKLEYAWKPIVCNHYKVFGHNLFKCNKRPRTTEENRKAKTDQNNEIGRDRLQVYKKKRNIRMRMENVEELKKNPNKYVVLSEENTDGADKSREELMIDKRLILDEFVKRKVHINFTNTKDWSYDMVSYFKYAWEAMIRRDAENSDEEDVEENTESVVQTVIADEVLGMVSDLNNNC